jgi:NADH-quinone oxidoreductase subunit L
MKAFIVNRVGDFGFSLGIFATFLVFGTVSIPDILAAAPAWRARRSASSAAASTR